MNRKLFSFGGVGTSAIGELEMFDEDNLLNVELLKLISLEYCLEKYF